MDAIEFVAFVAGLSIPDDRLRDDLSESVRKDALEAMLSEMSDDALCEHLSNLRTIVQMARVIQSEESSDDLHVTATMGVENGNLF